MIVFSLFLFIYFFFFWGGGGGGGGVSGVSMEIEFLLYSMGNYLVVLNKRRLTGNRPGTGDILDVKPGVVFTKGLSQVLGLSWLYFYTKVKPKTWLRPFVNTAPGEKLLPQHP